jgi:Protein of unknown function (DUF4236)
MGFRFQRRLNLTRGMGLNISRSGVSPSLRTRYGSVGSKGFSIRTGIPGLSYRQRFSRKSDTGLLILVILVALALLPVLLKLLVAVARLLWLVALWAVRVFVIAPVNLISWGAGSFADYIAYKRAIRRPGPRP